MNFTIENKMNREEIIRLTGRILILALILYLLGSFSFTDLQVQPAHFQHAAIFLIIALLDAIVLSVPILRARQGGWRLVLAMFLVIYAVQTLMVSLEAYYMSDVLSTETALKLLVNGAVQAAIFAPLGVAINGRLRGDDFQESTEILRARSLWNWVWRIPLTGVAYVAIFILAGIVIFRPLAFSLDPVAAGDYLSSFAVENPNAILGFQFLRGALWALLTLPVIALMRRPRWTIGLTIALIYGVVMGLPNLVPNDVLTPGLQIAHTVEVFSGNFLFGWAVVGLLARPAGETESKDVERESTQVLEAGMG